MQDYGPELEQRLRQHLKPTNKSWRVDETYVRVKGRWCYLYRAIDSMGATIGFLLSALRDADAAKRLFRNALSDRSHPQPRVINTDLAPIYSSAIPDTKKEGTLRNRCRHRPVQYLNNILEQNHRAIKRRVNAKQGFREFQAGKTRSSRTKAQSHWGTKSNVKQKAATESALLVRGPGKPRSRGVREPRFLRMRTAQSRQRRASPIAKSCWYRQAPPREELPLQ